MAAETHFRAMGSDVHVIVDGDPSLLAQAERRLIDLEARWSRFQPTSEISGLNRSEGQLTIVSADTFRLISVSLEAWRLTGGRFDPTVLGDVVRAGYDRSIEQIDQNRQEAPLCSFETGAAGIVTLSSARAVALPSDVGFDPGGIGKGLAADIVAEELMALGADGVCVNVGGDLRVEGTHLGENIWVLGVDPAESGTLMALVRIGRGAVATSTKLRRRWTIGGAPAHHIIDPMTGAPSLSDLESVSVVAGECWRAEALAKAAMIAGTCGAAALIDANGAAAIAVDARGTRFLSGELHDQLIEEVAA